MCDVKYLLNLIDEKMTLFPIPEMIDFDFDIWVHERIYFWAVEVSYYLEKVKNKDYLIEEILKTL